MAPNRICLNVQLHYVLWIYFLFLHVKFKTIPKISQFGYVHYTLACFHAVGKPIQYKNRTELFVLNGNKKPIRYEFHNGVKSNRYNANMIAD